MRKSDHFSIDEHVITVPPVIVYAPLCGSRNPVARKTGTLLLHTLGRSIRLHRGLLLLTGMLSLQRGLLLLLCLG